jgi:hypothetical protein
MGMGRQTPAAAELNRLALAAKAPAGKIDASVTRLLPHGNALDKGEIHVCNSSGRQREDFKTGASGHIAAATITRPGRGRPTATVQALAAIR